MNTSTSTVFSLYEPSEIKDSLVLWHREAVGQDFERQRVCCTLRGRRRLMGWGGEALSNQVCQNDSGDERFRWGLCCLWKQVVEGVLQERMGMSVLKALWGGRLLVGSSSTFSHPKWTVVPHVGVFELPWP